MDRSAVDRLARYFETLTPQSVADLPRYYAGDAYFKDPFNEVRGIDQILPIFKRMYEQVVDPRFRVTQVVSEGSEAVLIWEMDFRFRPGARLESIRGVSHVRLDASGRVNWHRDYWDTAEELYQKIPVLGTFFRWLRRRSH
jgi:hypothetical protein